MTSILLIGLAIALLAIGIVARLRTAEPKNVKPAEKAEIMRQLLALSENETSTPGTAASVRLQVRVPSPSQRPRPGNVRRKSVAKIHR